MDVIFQKVKDERLKDDVTGKEIEYITKYLPNQQYLGEGIMKLAQGKDAKKSLCQMHFWLWWIYLKNDHTVLSVFQRSRGTNLGTKARLGLFFMYLSTIMFATALFYGVRENTWFGDVAASFIISLIATIPVLLTKNVFIKSKPKMIPRTINADEFDDLDKINTFEEGMAGDDGKEEEALLQDDDEDEQQVKIVSASPDSQNTLRSPQTTKQYHTSLDVIKTNKMNTKQATLKNAMSEVKKTKSTAAQIKLANDVRLTLFNTIYPLDRRCRICAWIFLVLWTLFAVVIAMNYGLQFDLEYEATQNTDNESLSKYDEECWENNKLLVIEDSLSIQSFTELQDSIKSNFNGDYSENYPETTKWLLSCLLSLILSIFLWQPITIYITTWIKIWMFSWNLRMKVSPRNMKILCKRCCSKRNSSEQNKEIYSAADGRTGDKKSQAYYIIAHQDRPLDVIGYFSNDELFLRINQKTGKLRNPESDTDLDTEDEDDKVLTTQNNPKKKGRTANLGFEGGAQETEMVGLKNDEKEEENVAIVQIEKEQGRIMAVGDSDDEDDALILVNVEENKARNKEIDKSKDQNSNDKEQNITNGDKVIDTLNEKSNDNNDYDGGYAD